MSSHAYGPADRCVGTDTDDRLHELDAEGWQRGGNDDVERTSRPSTVNPIFRIAMADVPAFLRYAWGQVESVFEPRAFARLSVRYRDAVLEELETDASLPAPT